jgi:hypothetical protein
LLGLTVAREVLDLVLGCNGGNREEEIGTDARLYVRNDHMKMILLVAGTLSVFFESFEVRLYNITIKKPFIDQ